MPAPTALQRAPEDLSQEEIAHPPEQPELVDDDAVIPILSSDEPNDQPQVPTTAAASDTQMDLDPDSTTLPQGQEAETETTTALFAPEKVTKTSHRREERKVRIPPHRMTPLKTHWPKIYPPLVEHLHLQIRMNPAKKVVELRTSSSTPDPGNAIQKGADFLTAFTLGFDLDDAIALLRLDDLYIQSFEVKDVKALSGEHLGRAVGRIAGKDGKTKFAIENASRTRIVLADSKVHILGGFRNIGIAREAVVSLILGSPPGKVYGNLRTVSARMKERF